MPAGVVDLKNDALVGTGSNRGREIGEHLFEQGLGYRICDVPNGGAGGGLDETGGVEPFVSMVSQRDGPLADGRPHATRDGLQAEAMFVRAPDLDLGVGMGLTLLLDGVLEFFLKTSRSASPAAAG